MVFDGPRNLRQRIGDRQVRKLKLKSRTVRLPRVINLHTTLSQDATLQTRGDSI